ncbi:MAG: glutaredoxin family protein [Ardenticatenales bacterium]|nr:glutaredoxin family protein [Ardenticatenales bacterium]
MNSVSEPRPHARFITRGNCSLCEQAYPILERLALEGLITLERVTLEEHPELITHYGTHIPVVLLSTGHTFAGHISEYRLRKALAE